MKTKKTVIVRNGSYFNLLRIVISIALALNVLSCGSSSNTTPTQVDVPTHAADAVWDETNWDDSNWQ